MTTKQTEKNRWLTIADLENEYGFGKSAQYQMRKNKIIPFSKIGEKQNSPIRYDRVLIDQWLENNSVK